MLHHLHLCPPLGTAASVPDSGSCWAPEVLPGWDTWRCSVFPTREGWKHPPNTWASAELRSERGQGAGRGLGDECPGGLTLCKQQWPTGLPRSAAGG